MKKALIEHVTNGLIVIFFMAIAGGIIWQIALFHIARHTLATLETQDVRALIVYPGMDVGEPERQPLAFSAPDPIIDDFITYAKDIRFLWGNLRPVASPYKESWWSLTIHLKNNDVIEMSCSISAARPDMIHGVLNGGWLYKSHLLLQWYKKHRHRWLEPTKPPPYPAN